jgi:hypothetical protein
MNTRIRILHWLRLLLLSAGLAAGPCGRSPGGWFKNHRLIISRKIKQKRIQVLKYFTNTTMESHLRILRWLSLLLLSAGLAVGPPGGTLYEWFLRHRQIISRKIKRKRLKETNYIKTLTMKLRLQILHWLSLHILSTDKSGQLLAIVSASWFRQQRAALFKLQTIPNKTNNKNIKTTFKY